MDKLLQKAKERYRPGCCYLSLGYEGWTSTILCPEYDEPFYFQSNSIALFHGGGLVYYDEVWAPIVTESYSQFKKGDVVVRWRDIEDYEWNGIGDVSCPPIGKEVVVEDSNRSSSIHKLPSIAIDEWWYPSTAFTLAKYYNPDYKTNQGTVDTLNTNSYGNKNHSGKVQGPSASIITREGSTGSRIQGRRNVSVIRRGHLSYQTITGK
jgi:hypothetical protein